MTKAAYPPQGQPHSWRAIEELAECYACVVKLGGRQTQKRKTRASVARLCVKGAHVKECFYAIVKESRRAFKGAGNPKFNRRTVVVRTRGDYDLDGVLENETTMDEPDAAESDPDTSDPSSSDSDSDDSSDSESDTGPPGQWSSPPPGDHGSASGAAGSGATAAGGSDSAPPGDSAPQPAGGRSPPPGGASDADGRGGASDAAGGGAAAAGSNPPPSAASVKI